MLKKSLLTPILSGVLAVTVVGSGALYYFDRSGSDDKDEKSKEKNDKTISQVSENVGETLELAEKAVKGELDFAYNAKAEMIFGKGVTDEIGYELKPFSLETSTKQKNKKTAADISVKYDSKNLVSLNAVVDNETQTAFFKVPELSDAYLSASAEDLESAMGQYSDLSNAMGAYSTSMAVSGMDQASLDFLKDIDYEALLKDFEEYAEIVIDNCPEGKENGKLSGDINGNSYEYTVKTYDVTGQVVYDIVTALAEKAKDDTIFKDLWVDMGMSESEYTQAIDSILGQQKPDDEFLSESMLTVDVYYQGNVVTGFSTQIEDDTSIKMVYIENDDVFAIDFACTELTSQEGFALKGDAKNEGGKVNGKFDFNFDFGDSEKASMSMLFTDIAAQGDLFSGTIKFDMSIDEGGEKVAPSFELVSASTAEKLDLTMSVSESGTDYMTVKLTGEATDASDITVPSDNIYSLDEAGMESYLSTCNTDAFLENVKSALGDELYNAMFANETVYDENDYDFDDYDDFDYGTGTVIDDYDDESDDYDFENETVDEDYEKLLEMIG